MPSNNSGEKNQDYVARGLKATIHNDNTSDEAKQSAAQRLEEMGAEVPSDYAAPSGNKQQSDDDGNTGYEKPRATRNSGGSGGRKGGAGGAGDTDEWLEDDIDDTVDESYSRGLSGGATNNVMGGYKATLKRDNVSDEAKQHAQAVLDEAYADDN
ncbi:hypothetical protein D9613_011106 [Agrocybe pediades]|uniref:Uncharacterized protein n=1 Tax=Agrocybe pediades TaxID=84607 RepID=A0A8H4VJG3_9AGAR|nr:hypothetical protein D9613_011106 [Agrocybe pediades]